MAMRRLLPVLAGAFAAALLLPNVAVEARTLDDIIKSGSIKIGVHPVQPPMSVIDPAGNWSGFDIDVGNLLAERLGVKAEFVAQQVPDRVPNIISGRIDLSLGGLTRTPDRMKIIDYSFPLHTENMAVLTTDKYKDKKGYQDFNDPKFTLVGCRGCTPSKFMQDNAPNAKLELVEGTVDIVRMIAQGRADASVANLDFYSTFLKSYPDVKWYILPNIIRTAYDGIGVAKGNDTLRHWLNAWLYDIQSQGIHNQLWEKHHGMPPVVAVVPQPYW